jgi:drug/metabolite transporter (DMT)-like permease
VLAETIIDLPKIESRMLRWMISFAIVGVLAILAMGRWHVALAFTIGSALGVLNFHWLWETGKVLMEAQVGRVPVGTAFLMVARYPVAMAGLAFLYFSGCVPPLPVIAGLLVPSVGVIIESLFLIGADLRHKQAA